MPRKIVVRHISRVYHYVWKFVTNLISQFLMRGVGHQEVTTTTLDLHLSDSLHCPNPPKEVPNMVGQWPGHQLERVVLVDRVTVEQKEHSPASHPLSTCAAPVGQAGPKPPICFLLSHSWSLLETLFSQASAIHTALQAWDQEGRWCLSLPCRTGPCPPSFTFSLLGIHVVSTPEPPLLSNLDVPLTMVATWGQPEAGVAILGLVGREQQAHSPNQKIPAWRYWAYPQWLIKPYSVSLLTASL